MSVFDFTSKEKEELFHIFNSRETGFKEEEVSALQKVFIQINFYIPPQNYSLKKVG